MMSHTICFDFKPKWSKMVAYQSVCEFDIKFNSEVLYF